MLVIRSVLASIDKRYFCGKLHKLFKSMFYISKLFHHTSLWGIFHLSVCPSIWNSFRGHTSTIQCQRIKRFLKLNFCCCYHFPPIFDGKSMRSLFALPVTLCIGRGAPPCCRHTIMVLLQSNQNLSDKICQNFVFTTLFTKYKTNFPKKHSLFTWITVCTV